jgi:hypothetical protein
VWQQRRVRARGRTHIVGRRIAAVRDILERLSHVHADPHRVLDVDLHRVRLGRVNIDVRDERHG